MAAVGVVLLAMGLAGRRLLAQPQPEEEFLLEEEEPASATQAPPTRLDPGQVLVSVPAQTVTQIVPGFQKPPTPTPTPSPVRLPTLLPRLQPKLGPGVLTRTTPADLRIPPRARGYSAPVPALIGSPRKSSFE